MKSRPRARPLPRDAGRTRPPPSKRETGRHPGLFDGKQTGPFRPSQRNSNPPWTSQRETGPHPAFSTERKPITGLRKRNRPRPGLFIGEKTIPNGIQTRPGLPHRETGPHPAFSTEHKPTTGLLNRNRPRLGLPKGKQIRPSRPSQWEAGPHPAFSTEHKPTTGLLNGNRPRLGLPKGKQIRPSRPSQWEASPQSALPKGKHAGRTCTFAKGTQAAAPAFPTGSKPGPFGLPSGIQTRPGLPNGKQARIRPFQRNANP